MLKAILIGRTNVGKSTLFNSLRFKTKSLPSISFDRHGVTRDCNVALALLSDLNFLLTDTPGILECDNQDNYIRKRCEECDVLFMVVDGSQGVTPKDLKVADFIRPLHKTTVLVVNKSDKGVCDYEELYGLGFGDPIYVSSVQKHGFEDLYGCLNIAKESNEVDSTIDNNDIFLSVIGRPNTGKSTLVNSVARRQIVTVDNKAGTTRDAIKVSINFCDKTLSIIDTAGIKKRASRDKLDYLSFNSTVYAISMSDVVVLVVDAQEELSRQDIRVLDIAVQNDKSIVVVVNKIDLVKRDLNKVKKYFDPTVAKITKASVLYISALNSVGIAHLLKTCCDLYEKSRSFISTSKLNNWLRSAVEKNLPGIYNGKSIKFKYGVCVKTNPLTIRLFCNFPHSVGENYKRYLHNSLSTAFAIKGMPVKFIFSKSNNPYKA
ncbi:ribosome biogenesis GTPase Der [Candidatus Sneabacter namystus]|uniref:GTPase Der n=1 Tax=Candidatus Sneabacter namystus TaxID=2601646 RepID=A0A5C0UIK2_9RICK|nr:ribosome biogenesis GTPase Der [Candidatus Sneabacter namystus]QEK39580.1 ribosome biogenesis GTPase Der [Candidatus Sneabacter namystus]